MSAGNEHYHENQLQAGALVAQWIEAGNRYVTSVSEDANGNIVIVGQSGTTLVPWSAIKL